MNARAVKQSADLAIVRAWARAIYAGRDQVGTVHPTDKGWLAEDASGRLLGTFQKEKQAVGAVLDAARERCQ